MRLSETQKDGIHENFKMQLRDCKAELQPKEGDQLSYTIPPPFMNASNTTSLRGVTIDSHPRYTHNRNLANTPLSRYISSVFHPKTSIWSRPEEKQALGFMCIFSILGGDLNCVATHREELRTNRHLVAVTHDSGRD